MKKNKEKNSDIENLKKEFEENENLNKKEDSGKIEIEREEIKNKEEEQNDKNINKEEDNLASKLNEALDKVNELEMRNKEVQDQLLRKMAEFENYKRRTESDQLNLVKYGAESFIKNILPVYDDLERTKEHLSEGKNFESLKEGTLLVLNKLRKILEEQGIKKMEVKGKEFDFNYHDALLQQPTKDVPPHIVLEEVEPGYMYKDKVIKHAKVIVSAEMPDGEEDKSDNEEKGNKEN